MVSNKEFASNGERIVHYISFYCDETEASERSRVVAAQQKVGYISDCILNAGENLRIVSTALPNIKTKIYHPSKVVTLSNKEQHLYMAGLNPRNKLAGLFLTLRLIVYLLFSVKNNDCVIVYHSPSYIFPLKAFKLFKKNRFILEFNDLYQLLYKDPKKSEKMKKREQDLIKMPDAFILASPFMRELIGQRDNAVNYGSYTVSKDKSICNTEDNLIIYTGIVERLRKGAFVVAECAKYLPEGYRVQIAGFGSADDIEHLKQVCLDTNKATGRIAVEYVGCLNQAELSKLMCSAKLAINAHTYAEDEIWKSKYSFPSKIPLNMAHGLPVVTYPYEIITTSPMSDACIYFEELTAESMAKAIIEGVDKACNSNMDPRGIIARMDEAFVADLKELLNQ